MNRILLSTLSAFICFNVFGQSVISKGKPVTASQTHPSCSSSYVTDGVSTTVWNAGALAPQFVQIDLQGNYKVDQITLNPDLSPECITRQKILITNDFRNWKEIDDFSQYTRSGSIISRTYSNLTNIKGVRIVTASSSSWIAWREIEVYGSPMSPGSEATVTQNTSHPISLQGKQKFLVTKSGDTQPHLVDKIEANLNGGNFSVEVEGDQFILSPNGKKKGRYSDNYLTYTEVKNYPFYSEQTFTIRLYNGIFLSKYNWASGIYREQTSKWEVMPQLTFKDWSGQTWTATIAGVNDQNLQAAKAFANGEYEKENPKIVFDSTTWYGIGEKKRIGAMKFISYKINPEKIIVRAEVYDFDVVNTTRDYRKMYFHIETNVSGKKQTLEGKLCGIHQYDMNGSGMVKGYIDFFILPLNGLNFDETYKNSNEGSSWEIAGLKVFHQNDPIFIGSFSNYGGRTFDFKENEEEFIACNFKTKILENQNNASEIDAILKDKRFDISKFDNNIIQQFSTIPSLKNIAVAEQTKRLNEGKGSIAFKGWTYTGPLKNNIPHGKGVLTNPSPSGYAFGWVEYEYIGEWVNGKKEGEFIIKSMYMSQLYSTVMHDSKVRLFENDIDVTPSDDGPADLPSSAYQLQLSKNDIANVYAYTHTQNYASIQVTDGGGGLGAGANVDEKNYRVTYYDASGNIIKESKDPFNDSGTFLKSQLPGKVIVSYRKDPGSSFQTITLTVKEIGSYEIKINKY